jgi:hypothetical protein
MKATGSVVERFALVRREPRSRSAWELREGWLSCLLYFGFSRTLVRYKILFHDAANREIISFYAKQIFVTMLNNTQDNFSRMYVRVTFSIDDKLLSI